MKILQQMDTISSRLFNQKKYKYPTFFSACFDKQNEDGQIIE